MKLVIVLAALVAVCVAAPINGDESATILHDHNNHGSDNYDFNFETSNGILRQEAGELKQVGENPIIVVSGSASWTDPDGKLVELKYTADEYGYHPSV